MKKLLVIAALAALASPAFASKARLNSLGNAEHLIDPQTTFNNPSHMLWMSDFVTFETGPTTPTYSAATPPSKSASSEGGFVRSAGDARYMAYLGRDSDLTGVARQSQGFLTQENPIDLMYAMKGTWNWGVGLSLSNSDKKSTSQKQNAYGLRLGASNDLWEVYATIGLGSTATGSTGATNPGFITDTTAKYTGTTGFKVGAAYKVENLYSYLKYFQDGYKYESSAGAGLNAAVNGASTVVSQLDLGVVDHNKIDGGQWFYGVALQIYQNKMDGAANAAANSKTDAQYLPFLLGLEYDAATWATLRASVTQNVLIGTTKTAGAAPSPADSVDTISNNTTVAGGLGLHLNKFVIDGSLAASTTGNANTANLLTNVALTYNF